jgi:hypothetical protein
MAKNMESKTKTQTRNVPWKWIAIVACVILVFLTGFQLYGSASSILVPKHTVQVMYGGVYGGWMTTDILVVFTQNNQTKAYCRLTGGSGIYQNITLSEGFYIVKLYHANTGIYIRQFELCVFGDVKFSMMDVP